MVNVIKQSDKQALWQIVNHRLLNNNQQILSNKYYERKICDDNAIAAVAPSSCIFKQEIFPLEILLIELFIKAISARIRFLSKIMKTCSFKKNCNILCRLYNDVTP